MGRHRSITKRENTMEGGEGPTICWQRPHMERLKHCCLASQENDTARERGDTSFSRARRRGDASFSRASQVEDEAPHRPPVGR
ncbi:hypothetical protein GW17_00014320 [Ensete ventricosum]|nr:hypothetical protein GW17_00014320 [Ensete ventricosum]